VADAVATTGGLDHAVSAGAPVRVEARTTGTGGAGDDLAFSGADSLLLAAVALGSIGTGLVARRVGRLGITA
jgi:hypothetical protein